VSATKQSNDLDTPGFSPAPPILDVRFGGEHRTIGVGESLELRARWHGWFRLELSSDYVSTAEVEVSLEGP
jgi:hypothetical protein